MEKDVFGSMKTPIHRIVMYVTEVNDHWGLESIQERIEHGLDAGVTFVETETRDGGEWADDHPMNLRSTDKTAYFNSLPKAKS